MEYFSDAQVQQVNGGLEIGARSEWTKIYTVGDKTYIKMYELFLKRAPLQQINHAT